VQLELQTHADTCIHNLSCALNIHNNTTTPSSPISHHQPPNSNSEKEKSINVTERNVTQQSKACAASKEETIKYIKKRWHVRYWDISRDHAAEQGCVCICNGSDPDERASRYHIVRGGDGLRGRDEMSRASKVKKAGHGSLNFQTRRVPNGTWTRLRQRETRKRIL